MSWERPQERTTSSVLEPDQSRCLVCGCGRPISPAFALSIVDMLATAASPPLSLLILIASLTGLPVSDRTPAPVSWVCQVFPSRETT